MGVSLRGGQYSTIKYSIIQYSTVQYSTVQLLGFKVEKAIGLLGFLQYSIVHYSSVQYCTVHTLHNNTVQYSTTDSGRSLMMAGWGEPSSGLSKLILSR